MFTSVWLLDLINDTALEKKKNCCVKSLEIIQQKRWAASIVQLGTRSQRSGLEIIADEEYPQSSQETEVGQLNWKPYLWAIYPLSFQHFIYVTDRPFLSPHPKKIKNTTSWVWGGKKAQLEIELQQTESWLTYQNASISQKINHSEGLRKKVTIAGKVQIKVVSLPLIHSVGKILPHVHYVWMTHSVPWTKTPSHHGKSNMPAKRQVSTLIPWEAPMKVVQCCIAKVSAISLPSSAK